MRKIGSKIISVIMILMLIMGVTTAVYATTKVELEVVTKASTPKVFDDNQITVTKQIVANTNNSVDIEVGVQNSAKKEEKYKEIFFVYDLSGSMSIATSGGTRLQVVADATKEIVNGIYKKMDYVKFGIITFQGSSTTIADATQRLALTSDKSTVLSGINNIRRLAPTGSTNIEAGIERANQNFSKDCEDRTIILLTDGVPTHDIRGSGSPISATKDRLQKLHQSGIEIISVAVDMSTSAEQLFGTEANPFAGQLYNVNHTEMSKVVEGINNSIQNNATKIMRSITIQDIFPEEILENFTITYEKIPGKGNINTTINDRIRYELESLEVGDKETFTYRLTLKDNYNKNLIGKILDANKEVEIDYKDNKGTRKNTKLDNQPQIKLVQKNMDNENNNNGNDNNENNNNENNNNGNNNNENNNNGNNNNGNNNNGNNNNENNNNGNNNNENNNNENNNNGNNNNENNNNENNNNGNNNNENNNNGNNNNGNKNNAEKITGNTNTKDNTTATGKLPKTGENAIFIIIGIALLTLGGISYIKYKNLS